MTNGPQFICDAKETGNSQSKVASDAGAGPKMLPPLIRFMTDKDPTYMTQFDECVVQKTLKEIRTF